MSRPRALARWVDARVGGADALGTALRKVFPDHWSFMMGEVALYSFVVLVLTGIYLTFFFDPSQAETVYQGEYRALEGVTMSRAYRSVLRISFDVRAGLVMRQMHHWAALVFVAAIVVHLGRVFFTGAFRRPREINWMVGVTLLLLAIFNGFAGYSLVDDQLSGTGLRIAHAVALSVPLVGTWIVSLVFGGEFPGPDVIERLFVLHILLLPTIIGVLIAVHLAIVLRQKHTQFAGPGRREDNVVGERMWPTYAVKALALFFITASILAALGGLAQINPVWLYGPYDAAEVSSYSQPDWYMGWLEGALRLMPAWEIRALGYEIPNGFFPGALLPGLTFALLYLWPFLEARVTRDPADHHLLDRPRERPVRTALGVATIVFYVVLFLAGGSDLLATTFQVSLNRLTWFFRVMAVLGPFVAGYAAWRICRDLAGHSGTSAGTGTAAHAVDPTAGATGPQPRTGCSGKTSPTEAPVASHTED